MPRLLFEFRCKDGHITDHFVDTAIKEVDCPQCSKSANKLVSPPHFPLSQGVDTDMPTAAARWDKIQYAKNTGKMADSNNDSYGGGRPGHDDVG
ncbi:hypothetical protein E4G67_02260 [Candidatus Bathyarchaeota archaeon]|nr:MAG: hypothetical protein E4G67_02260 [Candidatus Bathyarchaeota archaeon]